MIPQPQKRAPYIGELFDNFDLIGFHLDAIAHAHIRSPAFSSASALCAIVAVVAASACAASLVFGTFGDGT